MMQSLPARAVGSYKGTTVAQNSQGAAGGGTCNTSSSNNTTTSTAGVGGRSSTLNNSLNSEDVPDSPRSAAPSPLVASQTQPSLNTNVDQSMPTLSPQPITKQEKDLNTSTGSASSKQGTESVGTPSLQVNGHLTPTSQQATGQSVNQTNSIHSAMSIKQENTGTVGQQLHIGLSKVSAQCQKYIKNRVY